jgi:hypothetical protein
MALRECDIIGNDTSSSKSGDISRHAYLPLISLLLRLGVLSGFLLSGLCLYLAPDTRGVAGVGEKTLSQDYLRNVRDRRNELEHWDDESETGERV